MESGGSPDRWVYGVQKNRVEAAEDRYHGLTPSEEDPDILAEKFHQEKERLTEMENQSRDEALSIKEEQRTLEDKVHQAVAELSKFERSKMNKQQPSMEIHDITFEKISDEISFIKALENGRLAEAEKFLDDVKRHKEGAPELAESLIDQLERKLFQGYYKIRDWIGALRIADSSVWDNSRKGRIKRLEELSGMKYEDID